jgi:hypothetical protein
VGILDRVGNSNDQEHTYIRALVHGDSGVGKTTSLKTLPKDTTLVCYTERGVLPLNGSGMNVLPIRTWKEAEDVLAEFSRGPVTINGKQIKTLVFDSLTALAILCRDAIFEDRDVLRAARGKKDVAATTYDDMMGIEEFGVLGTRMSNFVSAACNLHVNVIFTSLCANATDKKSGLTTKTVDVPGSFKTQASRHFDLFLYMESIEQPGPDNKPVANRYFRTFYDGAIGAKDASGKLDKWEPPNWTHVFLKIKGGTKSKKQEPQAVNAPETIATENATQEEEKKENAA